MDDDLGRLRDRLMDVFNLNLSDDQIKKLLVLCPRWDGILDTLGETEVMNSICNYFIGMKVPTFGDTKDYKDRFFQEISNKIESVKLFIHGA